MNSPKRLARMAGVLYLAVGICGTFAQGFVDLKPNFILKTLPTPLTLDFCAVLMICPSTGMVVHLEKRGR